MRFGLPASLSWRLLLAILPLVALAVGGITGLQYGSAREQLLNAIQKEIEVIAQRKASAIQGALRQNRDDLLNLSESPLIGDYLQNVEFGLLPEAETYRRQLDIFWKNFSARSGNYDELLFLDRRGKTICRVEGRDGSGGREGVGEAFQAARALPAGGWWSSPVRRGRGGRPGIDYAKPVLDPQGAFQGVLVLRANLKRVMTVLENVPGAGARALVRAPDGLITSPDGPALEGRFLEASAPVGEAGWVLVMQAPLAEALAPLEKVRNAAATSLLGGLGALGGVLLLLVRSITRPVNSLVTAARRIGAGDFSYRTEPAPGELGLVSSALNEMAGDLEANRRRNEELQAQLIQAEKLSAVGQLLSSVAHELRNPLASVYGYAQMWKGRKEIPKREEIESMYASAQRCGKVVDNLLSFTRRGSPERTPVDLNEAVGSALELLGNRLRKTGAASVSLELADGMPPVVADLQQVVQVIVNLVSNACDAVEGSGRPRRERLIVARTFVEGGQAAVSIEDNGPGIPEDVQRRIFEPFFTTKELGKGTGLGLSISRDIITRHGGVISFSSRPGGGTRFEVRLPVASKEELAAVMPRAQPGPRPAVPGRRVLVVDDEVPVAEMMARLLREDGDEALVASSPRDALALIEREDFDLVVSDMAMDEIKGQDIFAALSRRTKDPVRRFLVVTGDLLNRDVVEFLADTKCAYLNKPFEFDDFRQAVRRLLAG